MVTMAVADGAVQRLLPTEVLWPAVVDQALTRALELLTDADGSGRHQALTRDLAAVEVELRNSASRARGTPRTRVSRKPYSIER